MSDKISIEQRWFDDGMSDNTGQFKQCQTCMFRDPTIVNGEECGWKKGICKIYEYPEFKPHEIQMNKEECEYYENG